MLRLTICLILSLILASASAEVLNVTASNLPEIIENVTKAKSGLLIGFTRSTLLKFILTFYRALQEL